MLAQNARRRERVDEPGYAAGENCEHQCGLIFCRNVWRKTARARSALITKFGPQSGPDVAPLHAPDAAHREIDRPEDQAATPLLQAPDILVIAIHGIAEALRPVSRDAREI